MDVLGLIWIPDILFWITVAAAGLYLYATWPYSYLSSLGYKGPKPKPFTGNLGTVVSPNEHFGACDSMLKEKYGNIVAMYEGREPVLVIYDPEIIKEILVKQFWNFCDRRELHLRGIMSLAITDLCGDEWKRARYIITPFFSTSRLRNHMKLLNICNEKLQTTLDSFVDQNGNSLKPLDAKKVFGNFSMESICLTSFGVEVDSKDNSDVTLIEAARKMVNVKPGNFLLLMAVIFPFLNPLLDRMTSLFPEDVIKPMCSFIDAAIEQRRKSKEEYPDFLQALIRSYDEELQKKGKSDPNAHTSRGKGLTRKEILAHAMTFILAGYETTSTTLSFLVYNLASNPEWQERVVREINDVIGDQEITYDKLKDLTTLQMCIDETLRLYPAIFRYDRKTINDIVIKGKIFRKGCGVVIPIKALHHDPEFWTDPEKFDPERFAPDKKKDILNSYMYHPFGIGPRRCVGLRFALIEIQMAAVRMLQKYRWKLSPKTQLPLKLEAYFFPVVKGGMWLDIERR